MSIDDDLRVDLYLRDGVSEAVARQQRRIRSQLEETLQDRHLTIHEHPKRVPATEDGAVLERYRQVQTWATERGVSLSPFFEQRETYDPATDSIREMVTLPVLWLTLSERDGLRATYPHVDDAVATVSDAVTELRKEKPAADAAD